MTRPLGREEAAVLALAIPDLGEPASAETVRKLLEAPFDWGLFLDVACRQYVLPLVARNVLASGAVGETDGAVGLVPPALAMLLEHAYAANRRRNVVLREEAEAVALAFERDDIPVLLRKGLALTTELYHDHGARPMSDIDFLVRRRDGARAIEVLERLGYAAGVADRRGRMVVPWSRQGRNLMLMSVPNLPPMVRLTAIPECTSVNVGLTTGFFERNAGYTFDVEAAFHRSRPLVIGSVEIATTDEVDTLVDLCAHFFKDAKSHFSIEYGKDLTLLKTLDVRLALARVCELDRLGGLVERVECAGVAEPMWFTFAYVDALFPGGVPGDLLNRWEPADRSFLHLYGDNEKQPAVWNGDDLRARLFDRRRSERKAGRSRFWGLAQADGR